MSRLTESTLTGKIAKYLVEEEHKPKAKFCPRCGARMSGYPAISRFDNETEICSDCGNSEAMLNFTGANCNDPHCYDPNTGKKLKECNTKDIEESDSKEEIEERIGELRQAIADGVSEDEKKEMEKEIAELEGQLNESDEEDVVGFDKGRELERLHNDHKPLDKELYFAALNAIEELIDSTGDDEKQREDLISDLINNIKGKSPKNESCKLTEDSYEEPFFQEIEDALVNAGFDVDRYSDVGMLTKNLGWVVSNSEGEVQLTCSGTYLDESSKLKESFDFNDLNNIVKDAVYAAFEGSDFSVSGVELGDDGRITFNVTAYGSGEDKSEEMSREVELEVPEINFLDAVTYACTEWIYGHNSPDTFYESVTVVTGDGSSVNTTNTASVSTDDNCTVVNTGDTTVTICNDPAVTSPVEPIEDVTDIQGIVEDPESVEGETEVSDENITDAPDEEVPTEEPVENIEVADEEKTESVIVEDEDEIPDADAEGPEEPTNEVPTEVSTKDEVGEEPTEDDYETVNVTSLTVLKNQGDVYVLQTKNADGSESYYVCKNYNAETQEADEPQKFDTKEEADSAYLELVGVNEE